MPSQNSPASFPVARPDAFGLLADLKYKHFCENFLHSKTSILISAPKDNKCWVPDIPNLNKANDSEECRCLKN